MVVLNKGEFGKPDPQLDSSMKPKSSDSCSAFNNCDNRGMLKLNQELVVNKGNLNDFYRMDKGAPFATGLYAQVKRCKHLRTSKPNAYYAAKFSPRKRPGQTNDEECVENLHEIALLSQLKNQYIISFIDAFILHDCVVTIMELAPGGDLQTVIDADLVLLEKDASRYVFQLLEALKYLHDRHIAHLDIKPQNLLLMGEFPTCDIKLCDFEISRVIKPGKEVKEILGTPDYVAPEILLYEPLSTAADMWSVGILGYVLLTGFSPFGGDTDQETFRNIVHEPIDFPDELFEDVSPSAIDFIIKLAVKNAKLRPTPTEIEEHEWIKSLIPAIVHTVTSEPEVIQTNISTNDYGPKKRSPRKTMALSGLSTASAAGRRPSARSILRACKSAYDLNKMGGKTKSREALVEKMKMASGESSVGGGNWKLRKNLSKSREQLWESKIQLSKSCEKINHNLPGSTRWASVANFPSLDLGAMKSSTSQESVISVVSTCTNIGTAAQQDFYDWQQQSLDDFVCPTPQPYSVSMPNTPPIPNFDLSSPVNNISMVHESSASGINYNNCGSHPISDFNYPSLVNGTHDDDPSDANTSATQLSTVEQESQKSVAELIMTFGGSTGSNGRVQANAKKLDLKNQFEPILEVDGSEEQTISLGDCSDNNSTSGVSSIIATTPTTKEPKSAAESGNFSMNSCSSTEPGVEMPRNKSEVESSRRCSRTSQQLRDDMRSKTNSRHLGNETPTTARRGSISPPKVHESGLKGILKKPSFPNQAIGANNLHKSHDSNTNGINGHHIISTNMNHLFLQTPVGSRRGSISGNCTRLYDTHTISSLAKVPKRSILKNSQHAETKSRSYSIDNSACTIKKQGTERSSSKSPENIAVAPKDCIISQSDTNSSQNPTAPENSVCVTPGPDATVPTPYTPKVFNRGKIPKGLSPRERPSFILLSDVKPVRGKKTPSPSVASRSKKSTLNSTPSATRTSTLVKRPIRKSLESPTEVEKTSPTEQVTKKSPPGSPTGDIVHKNLTKNSKFKSELNIEPAAVAIKIFPPDPAIIPKSTVLLQSSLSQSQNLEQNNNDSNNNNNSNYDMDNGNSLVLKNNNTNSEPKSPEARKKSKTETVIKGNGLDKFEKSTWGIVCTGSIGRAMERFETGTIKGKKLRRGSVPDF